MMSLNDLEIRIKSIFDKEFNVTEFVASASDIFDEMKEFSGYEELKKSRLVKKLKEEILPVKRFLNHFQQSYEKITLCIGNQSYDGILKDKDEQIFYLEITCAKDGSLEPFQAKYMDNYSYLPISGVSKEVLKNAVDKNIEIQSLPVMVADEVDTLSHLVNVSIERKISKVNYNSNTILLVSVDTSSIISDKSFNSFAGKINIHKNQETFKMIYLVGSEDRFIRQICMKEVVPLPDSALIKE